MIRAVPRGPLPFCQGISAKVDMSGMRYWSDSAIRVKPSIDEPSNQVPCLTEPLSWWIGIVTALTRPMMSVNWSWMNRIPLAAAASIVSEVEAALSLSANWALLVCTWKVAEGSLRIGPRIGAGWFLVGPGTSVSMIHVVHDAQWNGPVLSEPQPSRPPGRRDGPNRVRKTV